MENLNDKQWDEFRLGDLFNVSRPVGRNKSNYCKGEIPFVASGSINNGVLELFAPKENEVLDSKNCITVSPVDGSAFFQAVDFLGRGGAGSSILILRNEKLKLDSGLFISRSIFQTCSKYTYGHMGNKDSIKRERIMLPVTNACEPDYDYMSSYVERKREEKLSKYKAYVQAKIDEIEYKDIPELSAKEWLKFSAFGENSFFEITTTSSSIDAIRLKSGSDEKIPYITRTDTKNGMARFVDASNMQNGYDESNCITIGLDTQTAFWQKHDFVTGQNIQIIRGDILNDYSAQFLLPIFRSQMKAKFNWGGNGATLGRMLRLELMLPTNESGEPDFEYMEQYAKNMMYKKYKQYLSYINK